MDPCTWTAEKRETASTSGLIEFSDSDTDSYSDTALDRLHSTELDAAQRADCPQPRILSQILVYACPTRTLTADHMVFVSFFLPSPLRAVLFRQACLEPASWLRPRPSPITEPQRRPSASCLPATRCPSHANVIRMVGPFRWAHRACKRLLSKEQNWAPQPMSYHTFLLA